MTNALTTTTAPFTSREIRDLVLEAGLNPNDWDLADVADSMNCFAQQSADGEQDRVNKQGVVTERCPGVAAIDFFEKLNEAPLNEATAPVLDADKLAEGWPLIWVRPSR
jgi:hypothetical protein